MYSRTERLVRYFLGFTLLFFMACDTGGGGCGEGGCDDLGCVAYRDGCGTGIKVVQQDSGGCGLGGCVADSVNLESCINDCGGCGDDGCGCLAAPEGAPRYAYPQDGPIIDQAVQLHITNNLFAFVNDRILEIVKALIGDQLGINGNSVEVCIPPNTDLGGVGSICNHGGDGWQTQEQRCSDGSNGCRINARLKPGDAIRIQPQGGDTPGLLVTVRIDQVRLGGSNGWLPASFTATGCNALRAGISPGSGDMVIQVPVRFGRNAANGNVEPYVVPGGINVSLGSLPGSIDLTCDGGGGGVFDSCGTFTCEITGGIAGAIARGEAQNITSEIANTIAGITCRGCSNNQDCAPGASCNGGVCRGGGYPVCQPISLGAEIGADVGSLLSSVIPGIESNLGVSAYVGGHVKSEAQGVELGMRFGATPVEFGNVVNGVLSSTRSRDACVAQQDPPTTRNDCTNGAVCPLISEIVAATSTPTVTGVDSQGNEITLGGEPFHIGVGISLSTINTMLWAATQGGLLCLDLDTDLFTELIGSEILSTSALGFFAPTLTRLTGSGNAAPVQISIRPSTAPYVELEETAVMLNTVLDEEGNVVSESAFPSTGLHVKMDRAALDFYAEIDGRYVRLFTAIVSLDLPLSAGIDGSQVVIGLPTDAAALAGAIIYEGATNVAYVDEADVANIFANLGGLLGTFTGVLGLDELIPPIDLGSLTDSLGGLVVEFPEPGLAAVGGAEALGAFVRLGFDPNALTAQGGATMPVIPTILDSNIDRPPAELVEAQAARARAAGEAIDLEAVGPEVTVSLGLHGLDASEAQFAYNVDGTGWSPWHMSNDLTVRHALLALEGHHTIRFRARIGNDWSTEGESVAKLRVTTDRTAPHVEIGAENNRAIIRVSDNLSSSERIQMRYRINDGQWTDYGTVLESIALGAFAGEVVELAVQVRDDSGNEAIITRDIDLQASTTEPTPEAPAAETKDSTVPTTTGEAGNPAAGCSSAPGSGGVPLGGVLALLAFFGLTRRQSPRTLILLISGAALALFMGGCSGDKSSSGPECPDGCPAGEICVGDGVCVDENSECAAGCPDGTECIEDACIAVCSADDDCGEGQTCEDGVCEDEPFVCTDSEQCEGDLVCRDGTCVANRCFSSDECAAPTPSCYLGNDLPEATRTCVPGVACPTKRDLCDCEDYETEEFIEATPNEYGFCESPEDASCECIEPQPLTLGQIAKYNDAESAADGSRQFAVSYNDTYGDLMFGEVNEDTSITWQFVDGVPTELPPTGLPAGPRAGIIEGGDDAGRWASLAVTSGPMVHIAYLAVDSDAGAQLRYARGSESGGEWSFETITLDDLDVPGYYADIDVDEDSGRIAIAYVALDMASEGEVGEGEEPTQEPDQHFVELRIASSASLAPATADEFVITPVAQEESKTPCGRPCASGTLCAGITNACESISTACEPPCGEQKCVDLNGAPTCVEQIRPSGLVRPPGTIGLFADLEITAEGIASVAYYDAQHGNLRFSLVDLNAEPPALIGVEPNIIDGENVTQNGSVDTGDVGAFADIALLPDGSARVAYFNASTGSLWAADPMSGASIELANGVTVETIAEGLELPANQIVGPDVDMFVDAEGLIFVIYQNASTGELLQLTWDGVVGGGAQISEPVVLLGAEAGENYLGEFGFFSDQTATTDGRIIIGTRFLFDPESEQNFATFAYVPVDTVDEEETDGEEETDEQPDEQPAE